MSARKPQPKFGWSEAVADDLKQRQAPTPRCPKCQSSTTSYVWINPQLAADVHHRCSACAHIFAVKTDDANNVRNVLGDITCVGVEGFAWIPDDTVWCDPDYQPPTGYEIFGESCTAGHETGATKFIKWYDTERGGIRNKNKIRDRSDCPSDEYCATARKAMHEWAHRARGLVGYKEPAPSISPSRPGDASRVPDTHMALISDPAAE